MEVRVNDQITIPASELRWSFSKSSAPGGQGVNTTDSRVRLSWNLLQTQALPEHLRTRALKALKCDTDGEVHVVVETERSQLQNRLAALERMAEIVRKAIAPPPAKRVKTRPSRAAREERLTEKKRNSEIKKSRSKSFDD